MKKISKIVISGGPCAGKSSALQYIKEKFTQKGWEVLLISESATELILGGIAPWTCKTKLDYQMYQSKLQLTKEAIFDDMAQNLQKDVLIVCDRGLMDAKAYMEENEFQEMLNQFYTTEEHWIQRYDAIFLLETTAKGAQAQYSFCTNQARSEGMEEAIRMDDLTIQSWESHPHCFYFDNSTDFEGKLAKLEKSIENFLTYDMVSL